ncbi:monosaccharide ABC transporter ATP-binding protein, CUT2 family [Psychrobacillus sp. OK028]|uniref:sugar ABC transporter ATP-binding protein n=1 Tax=Psychrobacillus sp. OK028 TaxID=1884359 RepID=UPI00089254A7|nr:sugar ABC transporter ATP-binding protein [Psychrobacillus sp. OK028]SDN88222.1 monosaccharide ABC transporter ATP-binding protein, CUT2 family [Psychrobacillus sp. OK028]
MPNPFLSMKAIDKTFGKVHALQKAEFHLQKGEVHALLGVNGAGKSTLMKILSGVYEQDMGEILFEGKKVRIRSPKVAKDQGIYCVYQEVDTAIVSELSVAENILLDSIVAGTSMFISKKKLNSEARDALKQLQAEDIPVEKPAFMLTLAEKQLVLIARALISSAKIIIFDEPTAPLSIHESTKLFSVIKRLKESGVGCIFISHRLPEVFEICDRITVMAEGKFVGTYSTSNTKQEEIIEAMLGTSYSKDFPVRTHTLGNTLLRVKKVSDGVKLRNISFDVSEGEIVGIVGLVGAGKTELAKTLFGYSPHTEGTIEVLGNTLKIKHPKDAIKAGMALIPEERRKEGLFVHEALQTNASFPNLQNFSRFLFMDKRKEKSFAKEIVERLQIKTSNTETPLVYLSGGNQQKVAIGKWTSLDSTLYLFDEPTKGVDIGAKTDIYRLVREFARKRKSCIYFSSEIHEVLGISDRILVMYDGQIVKELSREEATQERILLYASGGKEE